MPGSRAIITPERRSGRGPRNRGALLKASPTDRTIRALG